MYDSVLGHRLRRVRLERQISQADLARKLDISPAYLNLLEKGRRNMQLPLLSRALELLGVELDKFMSDTSERPDDILATLLDDPLARSLDLKDATANRLREDPQLATTISALYHLYKNTRAQLDTTLSRMAEDTGQPMPLSYNPADEIRDFLEASRNYFPELESAAKEFRAKAGLPRRFVSDQLIEAMEKHLNLKITVVPPTEGTSVVRKLDIENRTLSISTYLSEQSMKFQLCQVIGLLTLNETKFHEKQIESIGPRHPETPRLVKIHLANYFAGAVLMPYDTFFDEVQRTRYDVERVARAFETSYESVAHRLLNLSSRNRPGVPLHFLRVDVAGNISKRYSASGMRFPQSAGGCPKWSVHQAFLSPALITRQYEILPDNTMYFSFAKVVTEPQNGSVIRGTTYAIGLGTHASNAKHFVYADTLPRLDLQRSAIPIGVNCRFCERTDCNQRAAPSLKFPFAVDEYLKKDNSFSPLTNADGYEQGPDRIIESPQDPISHLADAELAALAMEPPPSED